MQRRRTGSNATRSPFASDACVECFIEALAVRHGEILQPEPEETYTDEAYSHPRVPAYPD
jgi:hypothetical protein